jgi:uncharacterized protein (DUF488 family)
MILYTIGHGNRSTSELISLLKENGVTQVVDARTSPYSRHNPQFNQENLEFFLGIYTFPDYLSGKNFHDLRN